MLERLVDHRLNSSSYGFGQAIDEDPVGSRLGAVLGGQVEGLAEADVPFRRQRQQAEGAEQRFGSLADLEAYLEELRDVPVAPLLQLEPETRYRLRIGLQVHPIAPAEQDRVEDVIAGVQRPRREGQDEQEAQVSMGRLIRFFFKGGDEGGAHQAVSAWFTRKELADAAH